MSRLQENDQAEQPELIDITVIARDFLRAVKKSIVLILILAVIGAAAFTVYKRVTYVPYYTASSTFIISTSADNTSGADYYNTSTAEQMSKTFPYILTSDILQRRVAQALGLDRVPGTIKAYTTEFTNFFTIAVTDTEPQRAYDTLQAVLVTYPSVSESIIGVSYMELMDETGIPSAPDNPKNTKKNIAAGAVMGILAGLFLAFIRMMVNKTVRQPEDCLRRVNSPCLGTVPYVRDKVRSRQVQQKKNICQENIDPEFTEAFRMIRNKVEHDAKRENIKTIIITSAMPGEGKSTVSANLAIALAMEGKRAALIDCDLRNPSIGAIVGAQEGPGLIDCLKGDVKIQECFVKGKELFHVKMPFLLVRGGKPVSDGTQYLTTENMKRVIDAMKEQMDYVILDTAPAGLLTDAALLAPLADGVIFVVKKDYTKADKILEAMEYISTGNIQSMGCVLNGES